METQREEVKTAAAVDNITTIQARATMVEADSSMVDSPRAIKVTKSFQINPVADINGEMVNDLPAVETKERIADDTIEAKLNAVDSVLDDGPSAARELPSVSIDSATTEVTPAPVVPQPHEEKVINYDAPVIEEIARPEEGGTENSDTSPVPCEEARTEPAKPTPTINSSQLLEADRLTSIKNEEKVESPDKETKPVKVFGELEMVKPVEYLPDSDIPDEDLERFLEELEEEDVENSLERTELTVTEDDQDTEQVTEDSAEEPEGAPKRPNYLELNGGETELAVTSAGTPVVRENEASEDLDNEINERGEAGVEDDSTSDAVPYKSTRVEAVNGNSSLNNLRPLGWIRPCRFSVNPPEKAWNPSICSRENPSFFFANLFQPE